MIELAVFVKAYPFRAGQGLRRFRDGGHYHNFFILAICAEAGRGVTLSGGDRVWRDRAKEEEKRSRMERTRPKADAC
jgi:hypothetical protein